MSRSQPVLIAQPLSLLMAGVAAVVLAVLDLPEDAIRDGEPEE